MSCKNFAFCYLGGSEGGYEYRKTAQNNIRKPQTAWLFKTAKPHQKSSKTASPQTYAPLINGFVSSGFVLEVWVKMPRKWNWNQTCFLIMVAGLVIYVYLLIRHPHRKKYVKELFIVLLTDPLLTWRCRSIWFQLSAINFNFLHSKISAFWTVWD